MYIHRSWFHLDYISLRMAREGFVYLQYLYNFKAKQVPTTGKLECPLVIITGTCRYTRTSDWSQYPSYKVTIQGTVLGTWADIQIRSDITTQWNTLMDVTHHTENGQTTRYGGSDVMYFQGPTTCHTSTSFHLWGASTPSRSTKGRCRGTTRKIHRILGQWKKRIPV